ncbi:MAG TPA: cyclic nucleotide-binding domain-containing protein [Verrucomicrobiae bacterium]|nr:cyclic nucleotide-binding domain-containing protein [Verrucomicrobiae bacterium]
MQSLTTLQELIASHPFLDGLDPKFLGFFESCASLRRFSSHQLIFEAGNEADHFYLILSGRVVLEAEVSGRGVLSIQTIGAGEALGWSWLFAPYQWRFTALTAAPTEVVSFGAGYLRQSAEANADFANELLRRIAKTVIQRLAASRDRLSELCSVSEHQLASPCLRF